MQIFSLPHERGRSPSHMGRFISWESCPLPTLYVLGGHKGRFGRRGEEKALLFLPEIDPRFLGHPASNAS
jgi:hypothetical protein